jgi:hypothetical protein
MKLNKDQKKAYNGATIDQAKEWSATDEKTTYICDTFNLYVRELDAVVNSDGLTFQDWIEEKFERLLNK